MICVEKIAGVKGVHPLDVDEHPGLHLLHARRSRRSAFTEAKAKAAWPCKLKRRQASRIMGNGKAIALGEPEGLVKTVFDAETGELLGAHMIGAEVTELIQGYTIAQDARDHRGRADAHGVPASHAQRDDAREAVLDAYGRVIHF